MPKSSMISLIARPWLVVFGNLGLLAIVSFCMFQHNTSMLLMANDGPTGIALAEMQRVYFGLTANLHGNVLEGLGNLSIPFNLTIFPVYWLGKIDSPRMFAIVYTWFAMQLFLSVLLIGWNHGFTMRVSYSAAWLLTLLMFPFASFFRIYPITSSTPHFVTIILVLALIDVGMQRLSLSTWLNSFLYFIVLLVGVTLGLVACPAALILIAPVLTILCGYSLWCAAKQHRFRRQSMLLVAACLVAMAAGWMEYVLGLILSSSASFYGAEMGAGFNYSLEYASLAFQYANAEMKWGAGLFFAGMLGAVLAIRHSRQYRGLGICIISAQLILMSVGIAIRYFSSLWTGLVPIYFEMCLFPFYALFCCYLFGCFLLWMPGVATFNVYFHKVLPVFIIGLAALYLVKTPAKLTRLGGYGLPPATTKITNILEKHIGIYPPSHFNGRVANVLPGDWASQLQYFANLNLLTGNDHQTTGLWLKFIPTLHEYNQLITPGFYKIYHSLLTAETNLPYRSWSHFNAIRLPILKLLGVRFVLTTMPVVKGAHLVTTLSTDNAHPLYLYDLGKTNHRGIAAHNVVEVPNLAIALDEMSQNKFHLDTAIVFAHSHWQQRHLAPVKQSVIIVERGGFHIKAESRGDSLLILPIEYSHCLTVNVLSGKEPQLFRVDIALLGVLFHQQVDMLVDNQAGPFMHPRCRLRDYRDVKNAFVASIT